MGFRNVQQIHDSAIAFIDGRLSGIRTEEGEPIVDLVDATAQEEANLYTTLEYLRRINSNDGWASVVTDQNFKNTLAAAIGVSSVTLNPALARALNVPDTLPSDIEAIIWYDLSRYAKSFGKPRNPGTYATSNERLFLSSSSPFTLLSGAIFKTPGQNSISYRTGDDLLAITPSFDAASNQYFVDVSIQCQTVGVAGNQIIGAINSTAQNIAGVLRVTNTIPAQGGFEPESNILLIQRLNGAFTGIGVDTLAGLQAFIGNQPGVLDVLVVGPSDPLMVRAVAGAVDIYIVGTQLKTAPIKTVIGASGESLVFQYQPLNNFNSAQNITSPATYVPGSGMVLNLDSGNFAGSSKANDGLTWDPSTGPAPGDTVIVNITYNALLAQIQQLLDNDPPSDVPSADILVRQAFQLGLVFQMQVVTNPGQDQGTVEQAVKNSINAYLSTFKQGQEVDFSTIEGVAQSTTVQGIPAVDHINGFMFGVLGGVLGTGNVVPNRNQYCRLYSVTFIEETGTSV